MPTWGKLEDVNLHAFIDAGVEETSNCQTLAENFVRDLERRTGRSYTADAVVTIRALVRERQLHARTIAKLPRQKRLE